MVDVSPVLLAKKTKMNKPVVTKKNPLILAVLSFTVLIFVIGTVLFLKFDYENKALKEALLSDGIQTKGYISSKLTQEDRRLSTTSFKWQHSSTHFITFEYKHLMEPEVNKLSLEYHLSENKDSKNTSTAAKGLGELEAQSIVDEALYNSLQLGESIDVVYLAGKPSSVKLLNKEGDVEIPMLSLFSYTCLFLTIGSIFSFYFYLKTGRTF
jgi:hypothetical protein